MYYTYILHFAIFPKKSWKVPFTINCLRISFCHFLFFSLTLSYQQSLPRDFGFDSLQNQQSADSLHYKRKKKDAILRSIFADLIENALNVMCLINVPFGNHEMNLPFRSISNRELNRRLPPCHRGWFCWSGLCGFWGRLYGVCVKRSCSWYSANGIPFKGCLITIWIH